MRPERAHPINAWGTHPRGSSTQERDRGRRDQAEVQQGRPPQNHADSTQGNNPRRDKGLRSDLPLYHNGEMDEAEPDIEEIESSTMGLIQEEGEPGEAGRSHNPYDQSLSPLRPFRVVEKQTCRPNTKPPYRTDMVSLTPKQGYTKTVGAYPSFESQ
jgi:hypothetical protein